MRRFFLALVAVFLTTGFWAEQAEARRFGGGSSFGIQRSAPAPRAAPSAPKPAAAPAAAPSRSGFLGPIAGLAAGLGLAALFSHLGMGADMAGLFLIGLIAFIAYRLFRRLGASAPQPVPSGAPYARTSVPDGPAPSTTAAAPAGASLSAAHADFDEAGFLRQAKLNFVRLQAAYDVGNLDDIRAFTSPEVFAEIKMQYDERAGAGQQTDVVDLSAELIELAEEGERYVVSVRFNGLIREEQGAAPAPFDEIWHLTKPRAGSGGWLVSGIQQSH
jgi:predicted lipid-binding transport protein (Tim44 family)